MPWFLIAALVVAVLGVVWTWQSHAARRKLYSNSRTLFWARLTQALAVLVAIWDFAFPIITSSQFQPLIPDGWQWVWPLIILALGRLFDHMRKVTSKAIEVRRAEL